MSKGSRPRPFSVSQQELGNRYDAIFGQKPPREQYVPPALPEELIQPPQAQWVSPEANMSPKVEQMKKGTCGCGRSPTGNCIGWHGLSESEFQSKLESYIADEQSKSAKDSDQAG